MTISRAWPLLLAGLVLLPSCGADGAPVRPGGEPDRAGGIDVSGTVGIGVSGSF